MFSHFCSQPDRPAQKMFLNLMKFPSQTADTETRNRYRNRHEFGKGGMGHHDLNTNIVRTSIWLYWCLIGALHSIYSVNYKISLSCNGAETCKPCFNGQNAEGHKLFIFFEDLIMPLKESRSCDLQIPFGKTSNQHSFIMSAALHPFAFLRLAFQLLSLHLLSRRQLTALKCGEIAMQLIIQGSHVKSIRRTGA